MKSRSPIARLNVRMRLEEPQATEDELGGRAVTWNALATVWAGILPLLDGSGDGLWHDQPAGRLRARIRLRRAASFTPAPGMRLVEVQGGRTWHIAAVHDPDGRRAYWDCLCDSRPL